MNKKTQEAIQALINLYKDMYQSKTLFNKSYFRYSPEEMDNILSNIISKEKNTKVLNKKPIRESILALKNEADVKKFYQENLLYDHGDEKAREERLKDYSTNELGYIYNLIYTSPIRSKARRAELLDLIEKYFESIDRAISMKP
jgi:hypothetical protein